MNSHILYDYSCGVVFSITCHVKMNISNLNWQFLIATHAWIIDKKCISFISTGLQRCLKFYYEMRDQETDIDIAD